MIDGLRPYPAYKECLVPWVGKVPTHWDVRQLAHIGRFFKGNGGTKEDEAPVGVPCVRYGDLYTTHAFFIEQSRSHISADRQVDYTPIRYGDVLFAASGETIDEIGKSAVNLMQSSACCGGDVILFRPSAEVNPRFMGYATDCRPAASQKASMCRGTTIKHIYGEQLKRLTIAVPPMVEQNAIVRFLDHADRQIRRYIRAKKKLIALLDEQKQTVIDRAVTRGLDPTVSLKRSGVAWLGDVPEHWVVASLRFRYRQCLGKMVDAKRATGTRLLPYLRNVDVQWDRINAVNLPQIDITAEEHERYTVRVGDLLVCEGRHLGRAAFWRGELPICAFQKALHRLRPRDPVNDSSRYLFYCLYVVHFKDAFGASSEDNSIPHLTGEMLRAHKFPFPPFEEQESIALYLDERVAALNRARAAVESEIEYVRQYRTRLIADVVTGKIDVREAAAHLPDASTPSEDEGLLAEEAAESDAAELDDAEAEVPA